MDRISYKGKIDTYLVLLENLNIKAGLSGIAWRVRVESKLPQDILRHLSHFSFATDEDLMEIFTKVARQEEELLERGKLTKSLTTLRAPPPKWKREERDKGFNTKYEKWDGTIKLESDLSYGKLLEITRQKIKLMLLRKTGAYQLEKGTWWNQERCGWKTKEGETLHLL